ncbi:cytochrome c biogenesis CcdA family protein [Primorskyibacter sp. S187A]|uniref:cytochrome c biogenesis CcdA family protein n=1 Tax=Primorskyibacter sp. S187A TaxID=3415130 RepID=UPI003C7E72E2
MEFLLAYAAGLLTLINPCVVPVLPIVLASAAQAGRGGPAYLALGMAASFVVLGLSVTAFGHLIGLDADSLARAGALVMIAFGAILLVPKLSTAFSTATAGVAASADSTMSRMEGTSPAGQLAGGALLGAVWSPCIGPTLGSAIALASQGESLLRAGSIMAFFAAGVATLILALGYGAKGILQRNREAFQRIANASRPLLGVTFVVVGLSLYFGLHHVIEIWALDNLPPWLVDLSVSI